MPGGPATPGLIKAIKELSARNAALETKAAALKTRAATAETKAAQATAATETFEARLRALEAGGTSTTQARK